MTTRTVCIVALVLVMAGGTSAEATTPRSGGEQEAALAEALAELHALGLQIEVLAAEAPTGTSAAVNAEEPAVTAAAAQTLRERFNQALQTLGTSIATDIRNQITQGVRRACQLSNDSGIELFSVSLSVGIVTATFRPTPDLCAALGEPD